MAQLKLLMVLFLLCFIKTSVQAAPVAADNDNAAAQLDEKSEDTEIKQKPDDNVNVKEIVISEKPFVMKNKKIEESSKNVPLANVPPVKASAKKEDTQIEHDPKSKLDESSEFKDEEAIKKNEQPVQENSVLPHEESVLYPNKMKPYSMYSEDLDIPDSYRMGSYFLVATSSVAILFIVFKIYRMRLSRAERKYGVQGNRATQELTPLPMSIDDLGNSDDEDQTLFDRHQIRIL